jgi:hypothetical protein
LIMSPGLHEEELDKRNKEKERKVRKRDEGTTTETPTIVATTCARIGKILGAGAKCWIQQPGGVESLNQYVTEFIQVIEALKAPGQEDPDKAWKSIEKAIDREIEMASNDKMKELAIARKAQLFHVLLATVLFDKGAQKEIIKTRKGGKKVSSRAKPSASKKPRVSKKVSIQEDNDDDSDSDGEDSD